MTPTDTGVMTTTLHITLITETFPPEINGVANTLGRLCDGLRARGHQVELVRPRQRPVTNVVAIVVFAVTFLPILAAYYLTRDGDQTAGAGK